MINANTPADQPSTPTSLLVVLTFLNSAGKKRPLLILVHTDVVWRATREVAGRFWSVRGLVRSLFRLASSPTGCSPRSVENPLLACVERREVCLLKMVRPPSLELGTPGLGNREHETISLRI
jgi:hypothetical protein